MIFYFTRISVNFIQLRHLVNYLIKGTQLCPVDYTDPIRSLYNPRCMSKHKICRTDIVSVSVVMMASVGDVVPLKASLIKKN